MDRREFFETSGCGILGLMLAHFGLTAPAIAADEEMTKEEYVAKLLIEKMGKTEAEAKMMVEEFKKKLPKVQEMCICKKCPSYVEGATGTGFCHPLVGKSKKITKEKGCICGSCPVYMKMKLTKGYYCTRGSEMEMKIREKAKKE